MKIEYRKILYIISISITVGFVFNSFSSTGIPIIRETKNIPKLENVDNQLTSEPSYYLIDLKLTHQLFEEESAIFIDGRDHWDFNDGHIPNSINIQAYKFSPDDSKVSSLDKNEKYVVYCSGSNCDIAKRLAEKLVAIGFTNLLVFEGGWFEWKSANLPVEKGAGNE